MILQAPHQKPQLVEHHQVECWVSFELFLELELLGFFFKPAKFNWRQTYIPKNILHSSPRETCVSCDLNISTSLPQKKRLHI